MDWRIVVEKYCLRSNDIFRRSYQVFDVKALDEICVN